MDTSDLLERLRVQTGCPYLSELCSPPYGMAPLYELVKIAPQEYLLAALENAINYLIQGK